MSSACLRKDIRLGGGLKDSLRPNEPRELRLCLRFGGVLAGESTSTTEAHGERPSPGVPPTSLRLHSNLRIKGELAEEAATEASTFGVEGASPARSSD